MLVSRDAMASFSVLRQEIGDSALADLDRLLVGVSGEPRPVQVEALMELVPDIGARYSQVTSMVAAEFFTELMEMQEVPRPVAPEVLEDAERSSWQSLVGWSSNRSLAEQAANDAFFSLLAGGLTKRLTEASASTLIQNGMRQSKYRFSRTMSVQRVPQAGCCAFCGMLASRGAVYRSREAALTVVGRGSPLGHHKLSKGVQTRGSRAVGELFHDHCRCDVAVLKDSNAVQLKEDADKYYDSYYDAAHEIQKGRTLISKKYTLKDGTVKSRHVWADAEGKRMTPEATTAMILSKMRQDLGVK